jgi:DNA topoisomerase I
LRTTSPKLKDADELYLATDEDREGEAIAWHLLEVLKPKVPVKRMVFHEITRRPSSDAIENSRDLDDRLVDAQETRRILDRLYGYEVSEVLWKKVNRGLSAGRVQSVATRLVVERERERMAFVAADYWDLEAAFADPAHRSRFAPRWRLDGPGWPRAGLRRRRAEGHPRRRRACSTRAAATGWPAGSTGPPFTVRSVERSPTRRRPSRRS